MTSIQPNGPSTLFNDDVLAAQNKISSINVDSQIALIWQWLNDLIIATSVTTRDDDTLIDSIVRLRNLHPEVSSIIASAIGWQPKINVRLATVANGNFNTAFADGQTVNGLVLVEDDRILIKDQTAAYRNGIYVVQSSGAPVRATDADTAAELGYAYVSVSDEDPTYPNSAWVLTQTSDEITLETTDLTWALAYNVDLSPYILGTGTAGKIALWSTDKILTNSSIREVDSRVTVGTADAKAEIATLQTVSGETGSGGTRSLVENQGNSSGGAGAIFDVYSGATLVSSMEIKVNNAGLTAISSGTTGSRTVFMSDDGTSTTFARPISIQPPVGGSDGDTQAVPRNLVALLDGTQPFTNTQQGIDPVISTDLTTKNYVDNAVSGVGVLFPNRSQTFTPGVFTFTPVLGRKYYIALGSGAGGAGGSGPPENNNATTWTAYAGGNGIYTAFEYTAIANDDWDVLVGGGGVGGAAGSGGASGGGGGGGSASKIDFNDSTNVIILGGGGGGGGGGSDDNDQDGGAGGAGGVAGTAGTHAGGAAGTLGAGTVNGGAGGTGGLNGPDVAGTPGSVGSSTITPSTLDDNDASWAFRQTVPAGGVAGGFKSPTATNSIGGNGDDGFVIVRWYEA